MKKPTIPQILADCIKQLMNDRSPDDITVKDILEASGVGRTTFYKYYYDKHALVEEVFQKELADPFFWDFSKDLIQREALFLHHLQKNRRFILNALKSTGQNSLYKFWLNQAINSVAKYLRAQSDYRLIPDEDLLFYARFIAYAYVNVNIDWLESDDPSTPEEMAKKLGRILMGGIDGLAAQ